MRFSRLKTLLALVMVFGLIAGSAWPSIAQDDATPAGDETAIEDTVPGDEEFPPAESDEEPPFGWLQISAVTCTDGDAGSVYILLAFEFEPAGDCIDGSASLQIDGIDYGAVAPYLEMQLEAGTHALYDPNSGAMRMLDIAADSVASIVIVAFVAPPEPTETAAPVEPASDPDTSQLLIVAHACVPNVQSVDDLSALGNLTNRLNACPAFTLPGDTAPGVTGGELDFDFLLTPDTGVQQSLSGNGIFVPDAFCEREVGLLDNDPTNDRCVSNSGYRFELPEEPVTLTQTWIPDNMRYVFAETGDPVDAGIVLASDPFSGYLDFDTSYAGTSQPVIHLFYLNPPRVNVVTHLCDPTITSPDDLTALGSLAAQLLTCPAVARTAEGGPVDFGVTVTDANWGARDLNWANFEWATICESDIGNWNGDVNDNVCLDAPTYRFDRTAMGYVTVALDYAPVGYTFGGVNSDEPWTIISVDIASGVTGLDTSVDGDVTLHIFDLVEIESTATPTRTPPATSTSSPTRTSLPATTTPTAPAATRTATFPTSTQTTTPTMTTVPPTGTATIESTPTSTRAPGGNGTLIVAALYCLSGNTSIVALSPGQQASQADMGGAGCFSGDATIQLSLADGSSIPALKLGRDGVESIQNIPATAGTLHTITEGLTNQSANFAIEPDTITRIIIRYGANSGMVVEGVDTPGGQSGATANGTSTAGLVTDELIGDAGVAGGGASYAGISFTSLVVDNVGVDAEAVSSITNAKSLPGVGVFPVPIERYALLAAVVGAMLAIVAWFTRRSARQDS